MLYWTLEYAAAFDYTKKALMSGPILKLPFWEKIFVIDTNTSGTGLGAALAQLYDEMIMPVSYASWTLKFYEWRYSTNE